MKQKTRTTEIKWDGSCIQVMCSETQPNKPSTWVKYPTSMYAKNQMPNNIVYKGQMFKFGHHECNSYNYDFPQIYVVSS